MVGVIRIDCFPNFKRTIGIVYWVTYFGLVVQDCLEAILHYTEIVFTAESSIEEQLQSIKACLLYTSPSPRDATLSRMPSSA